MSLPGVPHDSTKYPIRWRVATGKLFMKKALYHALNAYMRFVMHTVNDCLHQ